MGSIDFANGVGDSGMNNPGDIEAVSMRDGGPIECPDGVEKGKTAGLTLMENEMPKRGGKTVQSPTD